MERKKRIPGPSLGAHLARALSPNNNMLFRRVVTLVQSAAAPLLLPHVRPPPRYLCGTGGGGCDAGSGALAALLQSLVLAAPALAEKPRLPPHHPADPTPAADGTDKPEKPVLPVARAPLALRHPPAERIIAIGDVHGDAAAFRTALHSAGVMSAQGAWTGGRTVLVQVGDQLDRGDSECEIYETLFHLQDTAPLSGGAVHILLGNHELMNSSLDFRYVTRGGFIDFGRNGNGGGVPPPVKASAKRRERARIPKAVLSNIRALPVGMRARAKALSPGGALAAELAARAQIAVIVGDNVFVHAGIRPSHLSPSGVPPAEPAKALSSLARLNEQAREYLLGRRSKPQILRSSKGPVWMRDYSRKGVRPSSAECRMLAETLRLVRAKRMIVGHTPQPGINSACSGRVWRVDTGMSAAYGGVPEALEISRGGKIRIYTTNGQVQGSARYK